MNDIDLKKLISELSIDEKVGQLLQVAGSFYDKDALITGGLDYFKITEDELYMAGSILSISGAEKLKALQDECMAKQPHHIPQVFMLDIINGYETIYPVPIGQGATFNPKMAEKLAEVAAKEGTAAGIHVTFSPMVDLVRDARWGRCMESTGEDSYLNGLMGEAMVKGYQGDNIKDKGRMAACVKHFAAYGAPEGGRDYDNVELSERTLRGEYLPAYEACVKAGVKLVMTSFNTINQVPSTGNKWLVNDVLRGEMEFDGMVISDYGALKEMIAHNISKDEAESAKLAINATVDMDMMSLCYIRGLKELLSSGDISEDIIDEAVLRVLRLKNELGLFENPYKDADIELEDKILLCDEHRELARKAAEESFVLLENEDDILPLSNATDEIAFVGPYVDTKYVFGSWSFPKNLEAIVSIKDGVENIPYDGKITFSKGCQFFDENKRFKDGTEFIFDPSNVETDWETAIDNASKADKVVVCIGEHFQQTGEATSRTSLKIPKNQMKLLKAVSKVNDNIITLVFTGRPLDLRKVKELSKAVMVVWFPGTECGNAISNVLFGNSEPGGRVPMSFPYKVGQEPCYYNRFVTGRPNDGTLNQGFVNGYIDQIDKMLYPFGYGKTYTSFDYSKITLSSDTLSKEKSITASVTVTNTGKRAGTETVQMYIQDVNGSVVRPRKQLRGFEKVNLNQGESKDVTFVITEEMFRFYNIDMDYISEPGKCRVYIGKDSETDNVAEFNLV